jgi:hypothetical protein
MPRKALGERPLSPAERQARARAARQAARTADAQNVSAFRAALSRIADATSERMRTKAELQDAMDRVGVIAAEALANQVH